MGKPTQKFAAQQLFAMNMKRIRLEKKLTQENVAEGAGLHPNYISSVERGERNLSIFTLSIEVDLLVLWRYGPYVALGFLRQALYAQ